MAIGRSFQPGGEQNGMRGPSRPPVQEAVRLMSLRLPSVLGAQAPTPQSLMQGMGGAGLQGMGQGMSMGAALEMLRRLIQQGGMGASAGFGNVPSPSVDFPYQRGPNPPGGGDIFTNAPQGPPQTGGDILDTWPAPPPTGPEWNERPPGMPSPTDGFEPGDLQGWEPAGIARGEFNPNGPGAPERRRPGGFGDYQGPY